VWGRGAWHFPALISRGAKVLAGGRGPGEPWGLRAQI